MVSFNEKAMELNLINYNNLNCGWPTFCLSIQENKNICLGSQIV